MEMPQKPVSRVVIALVAMLSVIALVAMLYITGCASGLTNSSLERVAKDWSLTIRASQVIPVYPLTEDIQPGDVFLVQTPIGAQTDIYNSKGFLPVDQLVTRLQGLNYKRFYSDAYWKGTYAGPAHDRPGWTSGNPPPPVLAPQAAFPTYNFEVQQGVGIRLAVPIQAVPVGLGLMGATRATGTVSIQDAYTYAIDNESLLRKFYEWLRSSCDIPTMLAKIASAADSPIYLRVVNRVYLTRGVVASLINLDERSAGLDAGAAQAVSLPDLSTASPEQVKSAAEAYRDALNALSSPLNNPMQPLPGGSFRFLQASRRAVTMEEKFERPLAIGYLGFDIEVYPNGQVSAPVPSFDVLTGEASEHAFYRREKRLCI